MTRRLTGLALAAVLTLAALYTSAYWTFRLWPRREPPFGLEWLRPQGDLVDQWVRGTPLDVYEVLVWGVGVFLVLSAVQWLWGQITR
ncbi:MAG: hypothetical protein AAF913_05415 [Pseudomonadota bacterium]